MIGEGWGSSNPVYFLTSNFLPDASQELRSCFDELRRNSVSPENALRLVDFIEEMDVSEAARKVEAPTLIMHCKEDRIVPEEEGRYAAKTIPNSTFIELPGKNHVLLAGTPEFDQFFAETRRFLEKHNK